MHSNAKGSNMPYRKELQYIDEENDWKLAEMKYQLLFSKDA